MVSSQLDDDARVDTCTICGTQWLHLQIEIEGISRSGRWYRGNVTGLLVGDPRQTLAALDWYYCGGSYFDGQVHQTRGAIP